MLLKNPHQINLYYNPETELGKKCLAIASANKSTVNGIDITKTRVSQTDWSQIAEMLEINIQDLIDGRSDFVTKNIGGKVNFDDFDALKIIQNNPEVVTTPIAIFKDKILLASHENDLLRLQSSDSGTIKIP
jgi:arsenate reductase-like glutaredoxin family protein